MATMGLTEIIDILYNYNILAFFFFSRFATDTDVQQEVRTLQIARRQTLDFGVQETHDLYTRIT